MINTESAAPPHAPSGPEVFYDGDCPLCRREIQMLRRLDRHHRIRFTDIMAPDFHAKSLGKTHDDLMAEIHGKTPEGELITGVEVFRQLYAAVGLNWLIPVTRLPLIRHILDWSYQLFAKHRLRFTGRCSGRADCELDVGASS